MERKEGGLYGGKAAGHEMTHRAALLACTAIRSGVCLIPQFTGYFSVPVAYPWPGVLFRR